MPGRALRLGLLGRGLGVAARGAVALGGRRFGRAGGARFGGAGVRRALLLALALLCAVVGVVEAAALEVHGRRVHHALDGAAADLALRQRTVVHALGDLEGVSLRTAVLISRHGAGEYRRLASAND